VGSWVCRRCTFVNEAAADLCDACTTPSPNVWGTSYFPGSPSSPSNNHANTSTQTEKKKHGQKQEEEEKEKHPALPPSPSVLSRQRSLQRVQSIKEQLDQRKRNMSQSSSSKKPKHSIAISSSSSSRQHTWTDKDFSITSEQQGELDAMATKARQQWEDIMSMCRIFSNQYVDADFLPGKQTLKGQAVAWRRAGELNKERDTSPWAVFKGTPQAEHIQQGNLGDCWFLSALSVLATRPHLLLSTVVTHEYNDVGVYQARFCKDGQWQVVTVDDCFPVTSWGSLAYARGSHNQLWVPIVEKAYAKLYGSYSAIESGTCREALSDLTGAPCEDIDFNKEGLDLDMVWAQLLSSKQSGFLLGASCGSDRADSQAFERVGLQASHAYAVLDVAMEGRSRLIKFKNPWGSRSAHGKPNEWTGAWSRTSAQWTPALRRKYNVAAAGEQGGQAGVFWMELGDVMVYFYTITICKLQEAWHCLRFQDRFLPACSHPFTSQFMYEVSVVCSTWAFVSLIQPSSRGKPGSSHPRELGCIVSKSRGECLNDPYMLSHCKEKMSGGRVQVCADLMMADATCRYLIIPSNFTTSLSPNAAALPFVLVIQSANPVLVKKIPCTPFYPVVAMSVQLCAVASGKVTSLGKFAALHTLSQGGFILLVAVNRHPAAALCLEISVISSGLLSSRGSFNVKSQVPPLHRQTVVGLVCHNMFEGYQYSQSTKFHFQQLSAFEHSPPLNAAQDLHEPVPL